jgi:hypothetical protein
VLVHVVLVVFCMASKEGQQIHKTFHKMSCTVGANKLRSC